MNTEKKRPKLHYLAYLIRLWSEDAKNWRSTLENPHTGEQQGFASLDEMFAHIKQQTEKTAETDSHQLSAGSREKEGA